MQRTLLSRRRTVVLSLITAATGLTAALPVSAQEPAPAASSSSRFRVLVMPTLERRGEARADFGKKVAENVQKMIGTLPTHSAVESKEIKEALKRYRLKENEMDCVKNRQLAVQIDAELVMCGEYTPTAQGMQVAARFISAKTGETFEIAPFAATDPEQAASHIFQSFGNYIKQISFAAYCRDYLASQQWANALENCEQALAINPNSQTALNLKGMALYRSSMSADQSTVVDTAKLQQAYDVYKKVLSLNAVEQEALKQAGIIAARLGEAEASRQFFRDYLGLNPGDASVRLAIAGDAAKAGDPEGALRIVEEGLPADSTNADLLTYAGHFAISAAVKAGEDRAAPFYETALKYYGRLHQLKGAETDPAILKNMMLALVQLKRSQEAVNLGAQAVAAKRDDANLWLTYATALQGAGRVDEALAAIDSAIARDPNAEGVMMRRGRALLEAGRLTDARSALQSAVQRNAVSADEAAQIVFVEGYNKFRTGDWDSALEYFAVSRDLADGAKQRGQANFWSGMTHYQRGIAVAKPQNAKAARAALPIFQRALQFFQGAGVETYASETRGVKLAETISAVRQYIDIQQQLIKRGV